jgi:hypothetical protein
MTEIIRLLDSDLAALRARVSRALETIDDAPVVVDYFTHWYTPRPPLHEAVVLTRAPRHG